MTKFSFEFKSPLCAKLYALALPKGHMHSFSWREGNKGLDKSWEAWTKGWDQEKKEDFYAHLERAAIEQTRYRKKQLDGGEKLGRPRGIAVWFNACGWDDEIKSVSDKPTKKIGSKCANCNKRESFEIHEQLCGKCWSDKYSDLTALRDNYRTMDLIKKDDESKEQWLIRLKKITREKLSVITNTQHGTKKS